MDEIAELKRWRLVRFGFTSIKIGLITVILAAPVNSWLWLREWPELLTLIKCLLIAPVVVGMLLLCLAAPHRRTRMFVAASYGCLFGSLWRPIGVASEMVVVTFVAAAMAFFAGFLREAARFSSAPWLLMSCNLFLVFQMIGIASYSFVRLAEWDFNSHLMPIYVMGSTAWFLWLIIGTESALICRLSK